ncbi:hypothetical protein AB0Y20_01390 [Heyndrickxia oleronia]|uniref:hypothetical protein n=1 Tax=Heyndrickxia oleronia TaxID=38875 RepID=UPI003F1F9489
MKTTLRFRKSEVIAYIEDKIQHGEANNDEMELYADFKWGNKLNVHTLKKLDKEMKVIWNGKI